jgi:hypothetical protein
MQVFVLVGLRRFSPPANPLLPGVREEIVHELFTEWPRPFVSRAQVLKVTPLGTGSPPPELERFGPSTLVEARTEPTRCRIAVAWLTNGGSSTALANELINAPGSASRPTSPAADQ